MVRSRCRCGGSRRFRARNKIRLATEDFGTGCCNQVEILTTCQRLNTLFCCTCSGGREFIRPRKKQLGPNLLGPGTTENLVLVGDNGIQRVEAEDLETVLGSCARTLSRTRSCMSGIGLGGF